MSESRVMYLGKKWPKYSDKNIIMGKKNGGRMRHIILGTAGHIDHGKSALVKALTGIDPDRLKEEKERGITIDIGFADIVYPESELTVGIVDVPGHEKLIKNMLAGAGGIDMVLLVIAADEGIMPQSREHLSICNILKIKSGLIAITKSDLVEKEWIELVREDIRGFVRGTFLQDSVIIPVSSKTGENIELLRKQIGELALTIAPKSSDGLFRLPIDRVFTLKGFGTVVTGTAISGRIALEEPLEILPAGIKTKVRGLHSHGRAIKTASAGQRVAVNLQGVEKEDLKRGDVAVTSVSFEQAKNIDVFIELLEDVPALKNRSLVHFYTGTSETIARAVLYGRDELKAGESCYCQLRLKDPVIALSGDHYIIRRFSPLETLGGGEVLDPSPPRRRRKEIISDLEVFHSGTLARKISLKIEHARATGTSVRRLLAWINAGTGDLSEALENLTDSGEVVRFEDILIHRKSLDSLQKGIRGLLQSFHEKNPLKHGMPKEEVRNQLRIDPRMFNFILSGLEVVVTEKNLLRLRDFRIELTSSEENFKTRILETIEKSGFQPPSREELASVFQMDQKRVSDILNILAKEGSTIRISETFSLSKKVYEKMMGLLRGFFATKKEMTVADFRDLLNTTRKYALPFLEYLDSHKITIRTGDVRKLLLKE
jgi:selenocysteine-specific elongation factor